MPAVPRDQDESRFRDWLVHRVKHSRWTARNCPDLDAVAWRIGVQADVLVDAQAALDAEQRAAGRTPVQIGKRLQVQKQTGFSIDLPPIVYEDLRAYCKLRQLAITVVMRSLITKLLTGTAQPQWLGRGWYYKGNHYPAARQGERHPVRADVTSGATEALGRRAVVCGVSVSALLRGMVIDLLEGRISRMVIVNSLTQMPDDASKYVTLEEGP